MGDLTEATAVSGLIHDTGTVEMPDTSAWTDDDVSASGVKVRDVPFVSVGGGLASFAVVDMLRVCGTPAGAIGVVTPQREPYDTLRYLLRTSQIQDDDPLRSDSMSRIGNVWGFPSYAVERAIRRRTVRPLLRVLCEPVAAEFFNPTATEVFADIDREAARIGWDEMLVPGRAVCLKRRVGGGYFVLVQPLNKTHQELIRAEHVHLGTGYSAIGYPPEVSEYRLRHREFVRVVNGYEPHEHVYEVLIRKGGTVIVRGGGITASRVLQRLIDDRAKSGHTVRILHLFRSYTGQPKGSWRFRRPGGDGWRFQAFNFPKAAGAGQLRRPLLKMSEADRAAFLTRIGGATTPRRTSWQRQLREVRKAGFYQALSGEATRIEPAADDRVRVVLDGNAALEADFIIDCTGLRAAPVESPLLGGLLSASPGASLSGLGGLSVGQHFEVTGMDSGQGRVYASGIIARGGYLGPVDSLWGFSHSAMLIADDLAHHGFCKRLGIARSAVAWLKWMMRKTP